MHLSKICIALSAATLFCLATIGMPPTAVIAQEPTFELPVQLVGFPVIVLAVRATNFVKKLAYSLSPQTYAQRTRRSVDSEYSYTAMDLNMAERRIVKELGSKACVLEEPCIENAMRPAKFGAQPNWEDILSNYKVQSTGMKQWYLLSVFLGDVIRNPMFCTQLAKRLECGRKVKDFAY